MMIDEMEAVHCTFFLNKNLKNEPVVYSITCKMRNMFCSIFIAPE